MRGHRPSPDSVQLDPLTLLLTLPDRGRSSGMKRRTDGWTSTSRRRRCVGAGASAVPSRGAASAASVRRVWGCVRTCLKPEASFPLQKKAPPPPPVSLPKAPQAATPGPGGLPGSSVNIFSRKAGNGQARAESRFGQFTCPADVPRVSDHSPCAKGPFFTCGGPRFARTLRARPVLSHCCSPQTPAAVRGGRAGRAGVEWARLGLALSW